MHGSHTNDLTMSKMCMIEMYLSFGGKVFSTETTVFNVSHVYYLLIYQSYYMNTNVYFSIKLFPVKKEVDIRTLSC